MLNRELESELEVTLAIRTGVSTGLVWPATSGPGTRSWAATP